MIRRVLTGGLSLLALGVASLSVAAPALASGTPGGEPEITDTQQLAGGAPQSSVRSGVKLTHDQAMAQITAAGIGIASSGNCFDRLNPNCTSLEQVNSGTIDQVIVLRNASACPLIITGGTEDAHGSHEGLSHWNGFKLDLRLETCLNNYIRASFTRVVPPTFGVEQYRAPSGNVYTNEGNHWDVYFG